MTVGSEPLISRLDLACEPSAMRFARAHARDVLLQWDVPRGVYGDALLIVAELATNAVRHRGAPRTPYDPEHGRPGVRGCALSLLIAGRDLYIAFRDEGDRPPVLREGSSLEENGRGLQLVAGLTEGAWGWQPLTSGGGKWVWGRLALPEQWQPPYRPLRASRRVPPGVHQGPESAEPSLLRHTAVGT